MREKKNKIINKERNRNESLKTESSLFSSLFKKWEISDPMALIGFIITRLWFLGVFIYLSIFVTKHWSKCVTFTSVDSQMNVNLNITGYNILFVVFIIMLIIPLIKTIKISPTGIEASKSESPNAILTRKTDEFSRQITSGDISNINIDEIKAELDEVKEGK